MDGFGHQLATEAAEAEGCSPQATNTEGTGLSSMFGFATQWGKKLQSDLQLTEFVSEFKKQSSEVSKAYTQDLAEFAQLVKTGASRGLDELTKLTQTASSQTDLKQSQQRVQRIFSRLGNDLEDLLRDAIVIEAPGSNSTEEQRQEARKIIYDRRMAQLAQLAEDRDTFLNPIEDTEQYKRFVEEFDLNDKREEIDRLLKSDIRTMYEELVPQVSHEVFWTRYFYHAWLIEQEEARRKKLVEAAVAATAEEEFSWDMDEEEKEPSGNEQAAGSAVEGTAAGSGETKPADGEPTGVKTADDKTDAKSEDAKSKDTKPAPKSDVKPEDTKLDTKLDTKPDTKPEDAKSKQNEPQPKPNDADAWDEWE